MVVEYGTLGDINKMPCLKCLVDNMNQFCSDKQNHKICGIVGEVVTIIKKLNKIEDAAFRSSTTALYKEHFKCRVEELNVEMPLEIHSFLMNVVVTLFKTANKSKRIKDYWGRFKTINI